MLEIMIKTIINQRVKVVVIASSDFMLIIA
jgi:hypothetical protein